MSLMDELKYIKRFYKGKVTKREFDKNDTAHHIFFHAVGMHKKADEVKKNEWKVYKKVFKR